ncbi:MAG: hypothetical protein HKN27_17210 [Silicimonas sp.]|nr:hypothetical protein [Silicimonas sp.]
MTMAESVEIRPNALMWLLGSAKTLLFGTLFCMTPVTAVIVLGWLMRRMRWQAGAEIAARPGWVMGARGSGWLSRLLGGFAANVREGVLAAFSLFLATIPFGAIWLLSWWAGWENSFSKGYEQAWVGPVLGLTGVVVFCVTMIWLPMAIVHQAVVNKALALFEWRRVRSVVRHTRWNYLMFAVVSVILALPLFGQRSLVVFASDLIPGFDNMSLQQVSGIASTVTLLTAGYVFVSLVILRGWSARVYARAVGRALKGPDAPLWQGIALATPAVGGRSWRLTHWVRAVFLAIIWFGLVTQIFVGQFMNHDWHLWVTHPFTLLPWAG